MTLTPRQGLLLVLLTLCWGINWPILKIGISQYPPLSFRSLAMALGLPVLWVAMRVLRVPITLPRGEWRELGKLTLTNMLVWHVVAILALQTLPSGRAAILGYTMPVFAALWGWALYGQRLGPRQAIGVAAASGGVGLLLWHELGRIAGQPWGALGMLAAAATWALGTQQLRRTTSRLPSLVLIWWMSVATTAVMGLLAVIFEHQRWGWPPPAVWGAVAFNAVLIFGFAQPAWLVLARALPPLASSLSVQMIPVLGVATGAWWLGEALHWQDGAALLLTAVAIGSVLWPARTAPAVEPPGAVPGTADDQRSA